MTRETAPRPVASYAIVNAEDFLPKEYEGSDCAQLTLVRQPNGLVLLQQLTTEKGISRPFDIFRTAEVDLEQSDRIIDYYYSQDRRIIKWIYDDYCSAITFPPSYWRDDIATLGQSAEPLMQHPYDAMMSQDYVLTEDELNGAHYTIDNPTCQKWTIPKDTLMRMTHRFEQMRRHLLFSDLPFQTR